MEGNNTLLKVGQEIGHPTGQAAGIARSNVTGLTPKSAETGISKALNVLAAAIDFLHTEVNHTSDILEPILLPADPSSEGKEDRPIGTKLEEEILNKADSVRQAAQLLRSLKNRIDL